jgi:pimeloyl-ACP methyl ester carboxylesterase
MAETGCTPRAVAQRQHAEAGDGPTADAVEAMEEYRVDAAGTSIRYLTLGAGRPLVLCHGFLSSAEEFGGRFRALASQRRLIIPDLPGNGDSPPLPRRHTVAAMAAAVAAMLTRLGVDEFDVAGLCLGASVACALVDRCGDRVERLVLHTPLLAPALVRRRYLEQVRALTVPPLWQAVVALSRNRAVSDLYKRYVIAEGDVDQQTSQANFDNQRRADPTAAREWLRDGIRYDGLAALLERPQRTLVIVAAQDRVVDAQRLRRLLGGQTRIRVFVDTEQGHGWNSAAVDRQLGVIQAFLTDSVS